MAIDEFSSVSPASIARLFARGRSAGMSLVLATQELADLKAIANPFLRDQVIGNLEALVSYRQNLAASAELVSGLAGMRGAWLSSQRTSPLLLGGAVPGRGFRRRGQEPIVDPSVVQRLGKGEAVVVCPGSGRQAVVTRMHRPGSGRQAVVTQMHEPKEGRK